MLIVLVVFVLLMVVALGARRLPGAGTGGSLARLELTLGESLVTLILILAILDVAFIIFSLWKRGRVVRLPPRRRRWMVRMLVFLAGFAVLLAVFSSLTQEPVDGTQVVDAEEAPDHAPARPPVPPWAWVVLAGGLVGGLAAVWSFAPPDTATSAQPVDARDRTDAARPDDEWKYVIPTGDDPRSRIIQVYAALETALANAGYERRSSETPLELAMRISDDLPGASQATVELTRLFVLARFSVHPITEGMRDEAITALDAVLGSLQAPADAGVI